MAHNVVLNAGSGGDTIVTVDLSLSTYPSTGELPASCLYVSTNTTTAPTPVTDANGLPVRPATSTTWTVTGTGGTFPVTDSGGSLTVDAPVGTPVFVRLSDGSAAISTLPVSLASVPSHAVTNAGTFVVQIDGTALTRLTSIATNTDSGAVAGNGAAATAQRVTLANDSTGIVSLTTSTASIGKLASNSGVDIGDVDVTSLPNVTLAAGTNTNEVVGDVAEDIALAGNPVRQGVRASAAIPSAMSADGDVVTPWADLNGRLVTKQQCGTSTVTTVADAATSTTLLSANTARKGCSVQNDSSAVMYLKCGTTASATDYTARLVQYSYWEAPYGYTGRIDAIWATDPGDGAARISEYT